MVIGSSALVSIFLNEAGRERFLELILGAEVKLLSAVTLVEAAAILVESRATNAVSRELDLFLHEASIEIVSTDAHQAELARMAFRKYEKGHHRANLNFGDCFTHALASVSGEHVLARGDEFERAGLDVGK